MAPAKKTAAKPTTAKRTSAKTAKTIRNLRGTPVHIRLGNQKDPYRIELAPRGTKGDVSTVPVNLQQDHAYVAGIDVLFEIITQTEARNIEYGPVGYRPSEVVRVDRPEDTVVRTEVDLGPDGKMPRPMGPTYVGEGYPGSDVALAEGLTDNPAMPENVPTKVIIERKRG